MKSKSIYLLAILTCFFVFSGGGAFAQLPTPIPEKVGCFSIDGKKFYKCGQSWTVSYNGVVYDCRCNCPDTGQD